MSDRDLTTTVSQVFGDVSQGTECRICGRNVEDRRMKYCSDYCSNIASAVMMLLNWSSVRRRIIERDDDTCQSCGFDYSKERRARDHIRARIDEQLGDRPEHPGIEATVEDDRDFDWDEYFERVKAWQDRREELQEKYGDPHECETTLEVDHIKPLSEGGHPFDPANLQTLCTKCHQQKSSREAAERSETPSASDLNKSLFEYVSGDTD